MLLRIPIANTCIAHTQPFSVVMPVFSGRSHISSGVSLRKDGFADSAGSNCRSKINASMMDGTCRLLPIREFLI